MKWLRSYLVLLLIAVLSTTLLITNPGHALATSAADQTIKLAQSLRIVGAPNSTTCAKDLTTSWDESLRNHISGDALDSYNVQEAYSVSLGYSDDGYGILPNAIEILWWESDDLPDTAAFNNADSQKSLIAYPTYRAILNIEWDTCDLQVHTQLLSGNYPMLVALEYVDNLPPASGNGGILPFLLYGVNVDYPAGYEGETVPSSYTPPSPTYIAIGDSFSSGEGNPPFEAGTDTGTNECHRSPQAYPRLLQNDPSLNLGIANFVACSGATTANVLHGGTSNGAWNEPAQVDALSEDTEVVTITVGGNDVGFGEYALACTVTVCGSSTFDYNHIMDAINDSNFYFSLTETYEAILEEAPNAQIYVAGYPHLAASNSDVCGIVDLTGAWAVVNQLNAVTADAVNDTAVSTLSTRLHFVDVNGINSPFNLMANIFAVEDRATLMGLTLSTKFIRFTRILLVSNITPPSSRE